MYIKVMCPRCKGKGWTLQTVYSKLGHYVKKGACKKCLGNGSFMKKAR